MKTYFALILIVLSLSACHDVNKQKQLEKIDSMLAKVDSIEQVYNKQQADTISVARIIFDITTTELRIKNNYEADTINKDLGHKMDQYKLARKRLKPMGKVASQIMLGTKEEREALKNLRKDVSEGAGDRSKYDKYINFEHNKVKQLSVLLKDFVETKEKCIQTYEELHPELEAFSMSLIKDKK